MDNKIKYIIAAVFSGILFALPWYRFFSGFILFFAFIPLLIYQGKVSTYKRIFSLNVFMLIHGVFMVWNLLALWWIMKFSVAGGLAIIILNAFFYTLPFWLFHITKSHFRKNWANYTLLIYWCAFEYLYLQASWALPWLHLGNAFYKDAAFIQWYEYTGILGGTCWVIFANLILYDIINYFLQKKHYPVVKISIFLLIIIIPVVFSIYRYRKVNTSGKNFSVLIVQPNINPLKEKYDRLSPSQQLNRILSLAKSKINNQTRLIVCPETALTDTIWSNRLHDDDQIKKIRQFLDGHPQAAMIIGAELFDSHFRGGNNKFKIYNTALHIDTSDQIGIYYKTKLVPVFEKQIFPGLACVIAPSRSKVFTPLSTKDNKKVFIDSSAALICYESIYGKYAVTNISRGAKVLLVITNDGWFGDTPGYRQHLGYSRLRAIETRRYIIRSANTGISAFISPRGTMIKTLGWNDAGAIKTDIMLNDKHTFYAQNGDYLGLVCLVLSSIILLLLILRGFWAGRHDNHA